ncbi:MULTISPECIES: DUF4209 domain-containing protein [Chryseobacterium]|jgi:hypothetical protein|uniref:DUF4209 domain-containing protein n=2 Tax=Chryseobacterium TaxID=59732 RepID=A0A101CE76_9FLAO|nr:MULTISPECIES: DUF4209 domain-containing protein [Chryseobacterium]KUJ54637.1 hypothetical protein AR686_17150 [Chryseobacterium aquaticum subsp. greenlandense]MBL7878434.1 DUF4209 domain-containing protein [Chryseobacterium gambrini]QQV01754.1 DUF4209 domain-containing protein [Chryseobacterium sp. FDAARGOS 1104]VFB05040.1 Uncharacterised protein [Chryseobacterium taihuense]
MSNDYQIPENIYSRELCSELYRIAQLFPEDQEIKKLLSLVRSPINGESFKIFTDDKNFTIPTIKTDNKEILARLHDFNFVSGGDDKINSIKKAIGLYEELYHKTQELNYFLRSLELIRKVKSIFKDRLVDFEEKTITIFSNLDSSYYQFLLVNTSEFLLENHSKHLLTNISLRLLSKHESENNYSAIKWQIKILNKLKHFTNNDMRIQNALYLEKEGDLLTSEKKERTYYPTILDLYTEALKEIKGIADQTVLKDRLSEKIKNEQKDFYELLKKITISTKLESDYTQWLDSLEIVDFQSGLTALLHLPILDEKNLSVWSDNNPNSSFGQFFDKYVHITGKGTISGSTDEKQFYINLARDHCRNVIIDLVIKITDRMIQKHSMSKNALASFLMTERSPFIPEGREAFFLEGLYLGFQNNFMTAGHLLIPQIENCLKNIVEKNGRNTIKLDEAVQHDNTLGSLLSLKESGNMLDGLCNKDLLSELNSFLIDGNSANFRNKICHGLASPAESYHYGVYVWWITLKMVLLTKEFFEIPKCDSNIS